MKNIALINDLSAIGRCSLTVALPILATYRLTPCPIPTAILSNQTGFSSYFFKDTTCYLDRYAKEFKNNDINFNGIYVGFFANEKGGESIINFINEFGKDLPILIDPVLGDNGKIFAFATDSFIGTMRELCKKGNIITPNLTEALALLFPREEVVGNFDKFTKSSKEVQLKLLNKLCVLLENKFSTSRIVITGVHQDSKIGNYLYEDKKGELCLHEKIGESYSGTGDILASSIFGGVLNGFSLHNSTKIGIDLIYSSLKKTIKEELGHNYGIAFEENLHLISDYLKNTNNIHNSENIDSNLRLKSGEFVIYSDGASRGNPGRGGYGAVLIRDGELLQQYSQGYKNTTNNRMELLGIIVPIEKIPDGSKIKVYSDSQYVVNAFNKNWLSSWQKNNWRKGNKSEVKNIDLWKRLLLAINNKTVEFIWVKGHNGNKYNEICDTLATKAADGNNLILDEMV